MGFETFINLDLKNKDILIIGCPATGKTFLSNKIIKDRNTILIHTDDYMKHGFKESLYFLLEDIEKYKKEGYKLIIEGVLGYRLLRKGQELGSYFPDIVIEVTIDQLKQLEIYRKERDHKKIKYIESFNKNVNTVLESYFSMTRINEPKWIKVYNKY